MGTEVDSGAGDDDDDDVDGSDSASIDVTEVDSGDDSSDETVVAETNTDDDSNGVGSLFRNKGSDSGVFGHYGEDEEVHWNVTLSKNALGNLWGMAVVIMAVCLISVCLFKKTNTTLVRYDDNECPV